MQESRYTFYTYQRVIASVRTNLAWPTYDPYLVRFRVTDINSYASCM